MQEFDKSGKWLIQHHGDSILRLAGITDILFWRPLQAELVQPRRFPDGLIEAWLPGRDRPDLFILELATYPERRLIEQAVRDAALVYLDRGVLPEVFALILHPKGNLRIKGEAQLDSPRGLTRWNFSWKVVELWTLPAEELLNAQDIGLVPWAPLAHSEESPESIVRRCRERIDREATPEEHENLIAVTMVLTDLRYNDPRLFQLLGGREAMIESPMLQEYVREREQAAVEKAIRETTEKVTKVVADAVTKKVTKKVAKEVAKEVAKANSIAILVGILTARFGVTTSDLEARLRLIDDHNRLKKLATQAAICPDLAAFRALLD